MTSPPEPPEASERPGEGAPSDPYEGTDPYAVTRRPGAPDRPRSPARWRRGRDSSDPAARSAAAARAVNARQRLAGGISEDDVPQRRTGSTMPGLAALGRAATGKRLGEGGEQGVPSDVRPYRVVDARPGSGLRPAGSERPSGGGGSGPGGSAGFGTVRKVFPQPSGAQEAGDQTAGPPEAGVRPAVETGGAGFPRARGTAPPRSDRASDEPLRAEMWGRAPQGSQGSRPSQGSRASRSAVAGSAVSGLASLRPPRRSRQKASWGGSSGSGAWRKGLVLALVVIVLGGAYVAVQALRGAPRPSLQATSRLSYVIPGTPPVLPWPLTGEGEVQVAGVGTLGSFGGSTPVAIGSVAKIMTAYLILRDHPLSAGSQGPSIPVTAADVTLYQADLAQGDSVVPVVAGQSFTELQAIQALLVPSGDNIAVLLARWDAGSETAFVAKMNATAASLGMTSTHYADVSGLSAQTVSTPADQLILAPLAMANPVFAATVAMRTVTLPTVSVPVPNYNTALGTYGIIGIKTGSTTSGCLVFAARHAVGGHIETIYGAVLGVLPTSPAQGFILAATTASQKLVAAVEKDVTALPVLPAGSVEAHVAAPWLPTPVPASTTGSLTLLGWPGLAVHIDIAQSGRLGHSIRSGVAVGEATVHLGTQRAVSALRTLGPVPGPSLGWRLTQL